MHVYLIAILRFHFWHPACVALFAHGIYQTLKCYCSSCELWYKQWSQSQQLKCNYPYIWHNYLRVFFIFCIILYTAYHFILTCTVFFTTPFYAVGGVGITQDDMFVSFLGSLVFHYFLFHAVHSSVSHLLQLHMQIPFNVSSSNCSLNWLWSFKYL